MRCTLMGLCDVETNVGNWIAFQFVDEGDDICRNHIDGDNICQALKSEPSESKKGTATENKTVMR